MKKPTKKQREALKKKQEKFLEDYHKLCEMYGFFLVPQLGIGVKEEDGAK